MEKRKQEGREGKVTEEGHRARKEEENNSNNILLSSLSSLQPVYCQCNYNNDNKTVRTEIKAFV